VQVGLAKVQLAICKSKHLLSPPGVFTGLDLVSFTKKNLTGETPGSIKLVKALSAAVRVQPEPLNALTNQSGRWMWKVNMAVEVFALPKT